MLLWRLPHKPVTVSDMIRDRVHTLSQPGHEVKVYIWLWWSRRVTISAENWLSEGQNLAHDFQQPTRWCLSSYRSGTTVQTTITLKTCLSDSLKTAVQNSSDHVLRLSLTSSGLFLHHAGSGLNVHHDSHMCLTFQLTRSENWSHSTRTRHCATDWLTHHCMSQHLAFS